MSTCSAAAAGTLASAANRARSAAIMTGRLRPNSMREPKGRASTALAAAATAVSDDTCHAGASRTRTATSPSAPAPIVLPAALTAYAPHSLLKSPPSDRTAAGYRRLPTLRPSHVFTLWRTRLLWGPCCRPCLVTTRSPRRVSCPSGCRRSTGSRSGTTCPPSKRVCGTSRRGARDRGQPGARDVRQHGRRPGTVGTAAEPRADRAVQPGVLGHQPGDPAHPGRGRAAAGRAQRRDQDGPGAVRPHPRPVRPAHRASVSTRSRTGCSSATTPTSCVPAPRSTRPRATGCAR